MDFFNYKNNSEITYKLGGEIIIYSDHIQKESLSFFFKFEDRDLLITNRAIYILKNI